MAAKISESVDAFLTFLRECEQLYHMARAEEKEANDLTQDILHSLELEPHRYHEYAAMAKELHSVRQKRRIAKDAAQLTELVVAWMSENRGVIKTLERLLGETRKEERQMSNRVYVPRVRKEAENPAENKSMRQPGG